MIRAWPYRFAGQTGSLFLACLCALLTTRAAAEDVPEISPEEAQRLAIPLEHVKTHVAKFSSLGSRVPGQPGHAQARDYIVQTLGSFGYRDGTQTTVIPGDALGKTALAAEAASPEGQAFTQLTPPATVLAPFNLRLTISDTDNSIKEGVVEVQGTDMDGQTRTEEIKLKASLNRQSIAAGNVAFSSITAIKFKNCSSVTAGEDTVEAGYDTRYHIGRHRFWGASPFDGGDGKLVLEQGVENTAAYPLYAVWPNGAAIVSTGLNGLTGKVIYAGEGSPSEFNGLPVEGALVLLEFPDGMKNSAEARWSQAASFGAKGAIYIEPERALRPTLERLFVSSPVEFPRFWMPRKEGLALKALLQEAQKKQASPSGKATITTAWKREVWDNIFLLVPGSGAITGTVKNADKLKTAIEALTPGQPAAMAARDKAVELLAQPKFLLKELNTTLEALQAGLKAENAPSSSVRDALNELQAELGSTVMLGAHYDASSVVPALAPGAEQSISCAALLELARKYRAEPPPRDTLLVFFGAHFQGLKSERELFAAIEKLPEIDSEGKLAGLIGRGLVYAGKSRVNGPGGKTYQGIIQRIAEDQGPLLERMSRARLDTHAAAATAEYAGDPDSAKLEEMILEEIAKKGGVSTQGLIVGLACLLLGIALMRGKASYPLVGLALLAIAVVIGMDFAALTPKALREYVLLVLRLGLLGAMGGFLWSMRGRHGTRLFLGSAALFASIVALVFWALQPYLSQTFPGSNQVADGKARLDELLNMMKEEAATLESSLERRLRVMRAESPAVQAYEQALGNIDAAPVQEQLKQPAGKAQLDAFLEMEGRRREYEVIGKYFYTLTTAGLALKTPQGANKLDSQVQEVIVNTARRLTGENDWGWQEYDRRKSNRAFAELAEARLSRAAEKASGRKTLFLSLDLSAGHNAVGLFYKGAFYNQPGDIESKYKGYWGRMVMPIAKAVEKSLGAAEPGTLMPDTLLENKGRRWDTYLGTPLALSAEIAVQTQMRGLTLATPYDRRMEWDTPQDSAWRLDEAPQAPEGALQGKTPWNHIESQLKIVGPFIWRFMAEGSITQESRFDEKLKNTGLSQVIFKTVRRGGSRSIFPNIPVPETLIHFCAGVNTTAGVRLNMFECTNPHGRARMPGTRRGANQPFELLRCEPGTGEITYAINKPKHGLDENKPFQVFIGAPTRNDQLELFAAQGVAVLDTIDPRYLVPLTRCKLLAGQTESQPHSYSTSHAYPQEPHRVLYAEPGTRIKCLFREGQFGVRLTLLDVADANYRRLLDRTTSTQVSAAEARGPGFQLGTRRILPWLPRRTATDLWCLGEQRLGELRSHSIGNAKLDNPEYPGPHSEGTVTVTQGNPVVARAPGSATAWNDQCYRMRFRVLGQGQTYGIKSVEGPDQLTLDGPYEGASGANLRFELTNQEPGLHNIARMRLAEAEAAEKAGNLGLAWQRYTEAWGLESRAYPEVLGTAHDSVMGVVFYLFLLLPFCFFIERLVWACKTIERQIGAFFGIFIGMFCLLWFVHPAFSLVAAPPIILLAFVIMSLAGIVIAIVYGKFNAEMRMMQQGIQGVQSADVNRASAGLVAVTLGISQMRRRKLRTLLTCLTVVLLTFTALSFTSMVPSLAQAHIDLSPGTEKDAPYQGFMLKQLNWDTLRIEAYDQFVSELEEEKLKVAPRFWRVAKAEQKVFVDLINGEGKISSPSSLMGLSPQEAELTPGRIKESLAAGRWLQPGDRSVILLPEELAKLVRPANYKEEDWSPDKALGQQLRLGSYTVEVVGVYKSSVFNNELRDLDGEPITPVDFSASQASRGAEQKTDSSADVTDLGAAASTRYQHVNASEAVIVPWQLAVLLGGDLRSVAVRCDDAKKLNYIKDRILKRVQKNLFVGLDGRRQLYASTPKTNLTGLGNLVVPLAISVLILLNVMIGAVYERNKEIKIFSALGLAPSHIAALFLAEAIVYATLGAILGYLLGQGAAMFIQLFGEQLGIGGLYLNYSSSSAVFVTGIVMFSVVASTAYPAWQASRAAAPSEDRSWGVPDPVGDEISLDLPFSFQRDLVPGAALFLHEYFDSHAESSLGKFTAKEVTLEAFHTDHGQGMCLFFIAWLSPYDLGVSQEVQIYIVPTTEGLYVTEASFFRISGYVTSWQRVNLPFLNALRKHLLIWRTFSPQQRLDYAIRGYYQFQEAFEAVGWPPPEGMELPPREELDQGDDEDGTDEPAEPKPAEPKPEPSTA